MGIQSLEQRLERMVDGVFSRHRSTIKPIELGRRMLREMDDHRSVDVKGRRIVPNDFRFRLNPRDHAGFADFEAALRTELADAAREYARDEGYHFLGGVTVTLADDDQQRPGRFSLESHLRPSSDAPASASVVTPAGDRITLGDAAIAIGRSSECGIALADSNISRRHAEIKRLGTNWAISDLQSTNGTLVNGERITTNRVLRDGDVITVGETNLRYETS